MAVMQRRVSECRGRWVLIRDRRTDLRYYVFSSVINVSNMPRGSSPQTPRLLAHRRECDTRVLRRYLNFPANDTDVNDQASRSARSSADVYRKRKVDESETVRIQWALCFRPCNPVNVRRNTRDTDRVRSVPSYGHTQRCIAYRMSSFVRYAANETHSEANKVVAMKQVFEVIRMKLREEKSRGYPSIDSHLKD